MNFIKTSKVLTAFPPIRRVRKGGLDSKASLGYITRQCPNKTRAKDIIGDGVFVQCVQGPWFISSTGKRERNPQNKTEFLKIYDKRLVYRTLTTLSKSLFSDSGQSTSGNGRRKQAREQVQTPASRHPMSASLPQLTLHDGAEWTIPCDGHGERSSLVHRLAGSRCRYRQDGKCARQSLQQLVRGTFSQWTELDSACDYHLLEHAGVPRIE